MKLHKKGQTYKQLLKVSEVIIANLQADIQNLQAALNEAKVTNPRTGNTFAKEAQEMYFTVALINAYLKEDTDNSRQMAAMMARGQLHSLGFNEVEIDSGEVLKDDAYTGEK